MNRSGAWYSYKDVRLGQGRENARQFIKDNKELGTEIEKKIREEFKIGNINATSATSEDAVLT